MLERDTSPVFTEEHRLFRDAVRRFIEREFLPRIAEFDEAGCVARNFWRKAGEAGLLCPGVPEAYGGPGLDFTFNAVLNEEITYAGMSDSITLQTDITSPYLVRYGSEELKQKWLPSMVSGEVISAIAMTEPGAGSDLQGVQTVARRDGDDFVITGNKTYITNGQNADIVLTVCKTNPAEGAKGTSIILVEADRPGFTRGKNLDKIGQWMSDTSELFYDEVRVPATNLIGEADRGFVYLVSDLPQERLSISITAQSAAQRAYDEAIAFTRDRKAFGRRVIDFQNTRFVLADMKAKLQVGWRHVDWMIAQHASGKLSAEEAAAGKLWHTETQWEICDAALQLHGGAGYMNEYPIARFWRDARVRRIYGGTSEIMKELVGRAL
ncbi:acyl-CoA dehydrogenase family protein [Hyphomonas sp.]|uniref:acyl-CoA dehydrogenase family protein n=1 Tax=Hyphomonas sp. TaxID=87 RepID=UPI003F707279